MVLAAAADCPWHQETAAPAPETKEALLELKEMVERGSIGSIVGEVYPMGHAAEAHRRVETEQPPGAVVITIGDPH